MAITDLEYAIKAVTAPIRQIEVTFQRLYGQTMAISRAYNQIIAPMRQMEAAAALVRELNKQTEAIMTSLTVYHWKILAAEIWQQQIEAITVPLRQAEAAALRNYSWMTLVTKWCELEETFALFLKTIKVKTTRGGDIYVIYRPSKKGLKLSLHPARLEKGWRPRVHIRDKNRYFTKPKYLPPDTDISKLSPRWIDLLKFFKRCEEQGCN